jgi:hypothetical protein
MRAVTRNAGQLASALQKATALSEINRLMTHVPRIVEISRDTLRGRHAVALAAQIVQFCRREISGITDIAASWRRCMSGAGTVTRLTSHAGLERLYRPRLGQAKAPGRVAAKTAKDARIRREGPVRHAFGSPMAGSERQPTGLSVPGKPVFYVRVLIRSRYVSNRLRASSEGPSIVSAPPAQCLGVMCVRLRSSDSGMTSGTGFRTCEILRRQEQ